MALVYRLQKPKYNATMLSGEGASRTGGRWNLIGTPLLYTSSTISLSILEVLVHLDKSLNPRFPDLNIAVLDLPDKFIHLFKEQDLPVGWNAQPALESTQQFLIPWLEPGNNLAFRVPSVINPHESNILLNCLHPELSEVVILDMIPYKFDSRL